jgi:hypothetical protein
LLQLFAQSVAINSEQLRGGALVALTPGHRELQQGSLDGGRHHIHQRMRTRTVEIGKVLIETSQNALLKRLAAACAADALAGRIREPS